MQALFVKGNSYLNEGQYARAASTYRKGLDQYPDSPYVTDFLYQLGITHYNSEDYEKAARAYCPSFR